MGKSDQKLEEAMQIHVMSVKISQHIDEKITKLEHYAMMQSKELQISLMDSVKALNADLFYWRSNLIEVPGMEHEHQHGHTHGYQPLAHLTPEMVLDIQKDLRNQIIQLNIRTQKLLDTLDNKNENELIEKKEKASRYGA